MVNNAADNPLFKHFRQPAVYLKLPSEGHFYPEGTLDLPPTGTIPIYPMTVKDELTLKTPDALMNGQGMVEVIHSCCPNIKDAWSMPAVDVDAIFIAIRLASYGSDMDITTSCTHCTETNEHSISLNHLLDSFKIADYEKLSFVDELKFKFKPQNYKHINDLSIITYEEQRLVDSVIRNEALSDEEKAVRFGNSFAKLKQMNVDAIAVCIESITPEGAEPVTDRKFITEYLENCSRESYQAIKDKIDAIIKSNKLESLKLTCSECQKEYESSLEFNQSNFFGNGF
jgi:hypothetical protein